MDTAPFIRRRSVMALWIIVPLALIAVVFTVSKSVLNQEQIAYVQSKALARVIPEMTAGLASFEQFAADYRVAPDAASSLEIRHIASLNAAAEYADFTINAISVVQDPPDKTPAGIIRINIQIKGTGSGSGISAFLNNIHAKDRLIYEKRISTVPDHTAGGAFLLDAELCKIYIARKGNVQ